MTDREKLIDETLEKLDDCLTWNVTGRDVEWDKPSARAVLEAFAATLLDVPVTMTADEIAVVERMNAMELRAITAEGQLSQWREWFAAHQRVCGRARRGHTLSHDPC